MILGLGGKAYLITGINAVNAIMSADKLPILSLNDWSWKNTPKFKIPSSHRGIKIVSSVTVGNLNKGI